MKTFLSILRGINVSGQKKVQMTELKILYEELNFKNVLTYIQSGNVIFKNENDRDLSNRIEKKILEKYNFEVPVLIRTSDEMQNIINNNRFLKIENIDLNKLYVTFLAENPTKEDIDNIEKHDYKPDEFYISGKEIYLYCPHGYGRTKLTNVFFENKLKVVASTRNWRTTNELANLTKSH